MELFVFEAEICHIFPTIHQWLEHQDSEVKTRSMKFLPDIENVGSIEFC